MPARMYPSVNRGPATTPHASNQRELKGTSPAGSRSAVAPAEDPRAARPPSSGIALLFGSDCASAYVAGAQTLFVHTCAPGHWVHAAVQLAPVVFVSGAQVAVGPVPHRWKPALHAGTQAVPLQVTVPFPG